VPIDDNRVRERRGFLKSTAALTGLLAVPGQPEGTRDVTARRAYGQRSPFEGAVRDSFAPEGHTPLHDQMGIITPSSLHYVVSHGYDPPEIDPREHRLLIHGLVDRPLIFTLEELKRLPSVSRIHFIECAGNTSPIEWPTARLVQHTHGWTSCSVWTGVPLSILLTEAGLQKTGSWILAEGADAAKLTKSIPIEKALDDVIVAYGQNGEAVRPENGYPLRLVVPGFEGLSHVKWLRRIKVVDEPYHARSESTGYSVLRPNLNGRAFWFNFEIGPKSVITRPSAGLRLPGRGFYEITGLAWSGGGAIRKVDVSIDDGRSWVPARLQEPVLRHAHTRFTVPWTWGGEDVVIQSRCTDERGDVQPTLRELAQLWGVTPDFFQAPRTRINHFNAVFPWRVKRDGSVETALFS
jgi:sulfane dehydrogenase subunit SoxC